MFIWVQIKCVHQYLESRFCSSKTESMIQMIGNVFNWRQKILYNSILKFQNCIDKRQEFLIGFQQFKSAVRLFETSFPQQQTHVTVFCVKM